MPKSKLFNINIFLQELKLSQLETTVCLSYRSSLKLSQSESLSAKLVLNTRMTWEKLSENFHGKYCISHDIKLLLSFFFAENTKMKTIREELKITSLSIDQICCCCYLPAKQRKHQVKIWEAGLVSVGSSV